MRPGAMSLERESIWTDLGEKLYLDGFDGITGYNYHRGKTTSADGTVSYLLPFDDLAHDHEVVWEGHTKFGKLLYMPCLSGGWDNRPNEKPKNRRLIPAIRRTSRRFPFTTISCAAANSRKNMPERRLTTLPLSTLGMKTAKAASSAPTKGFHNDGLLMACARAVRDLNS